MKLNRKQLIAYFITVAFSIGMIGIAEIFNRAEIIFPEIAALLIGGIIAPKKIWNVDKYTFWGLMCISSFVGIIIVRYLHIPIYLQVMAGFIFVILILTITKATLIPAISACILPILLRTEALIYPLSVCAFTFMLLVIQFFMEKKGLREEYPFEKTKLTADDIVRNIATIVVFAVIVAIPVYHNELYLIAPPLIVTFLEFSHPESSASHRSYDIWLIISTAGGLGYVLNLFVNAYGFSHILCTVLILCILLAIFHFAKIYFPPAGAICLLPLLLPYEGIYRYPLEVMLGSAVFIIAGNLVRKHANLNPPVKA